MKSDEELIDEFHTMSGHSISTIKSYRSVFNNYCDFHAMSLSDLLAEAITVSNTVSKIKIFYRHNRVYLPFILPLNSKILTRNDIISFRDSPTKDGIIQVLNFCDDNMALWILVILSSGMTRAEAKSITNEMFFYMDI